MLFRDKEKFDDGSLFYPDGSVSEVILEELLDKAHRWRYSKNRVMTCWRRVRVSDPDAEVPEYDRIRVKKTVGELREIYGRPYDPDAPVHQPTLLLITPYGVVDIGS